MLGEVGEAAIISIHAPSRERPYISSASGSYSSNFNPRSLTGATIKSGTSLVKDCNFNPRSLTGATLGVPAMALRSDISIHAPSRERPTGFTNDGRQLIFQSTLPHGSDLQYFVQHMQAASAFQSTLPHGSDNPPLLSMMLYTRYFNPRSLTGAT